MELADRDESSEGALENGKTIINQILGEMKNQFNKTDKRSHQQVAPDIQSEPHRKSSTLASSPGGDSSDHATEDSSMVPAVSNSSTTAIKTNLTLKSTSINNNINNNIKSCRDEKEPQTSSTSSSLLNLKNDDSNNSSATTQFEADEEPAVKEESTTTTITTTPEEDSSSLDEKQQQEQQKPRIVMTFRKPAAATTEDLFKAKSRGAAAANRRTLRTKMRGVIEDSILPKRSPRRRSRDCNESVLQSAIARKEKSYNESSRPQRLTRQLKPTPKILENLAANAAALKGRRMSSRLSHALQDSDPEAGGLSDEESEGDSAVTVPPVKTGKRKAKTRGGGGRLGASAGKRSRVFGASSNGSSKESDSDHSSESKESNSEVKAATKKKDAVVVSLGEAEKPCRRSHRLSSRVKSCEDSSIEQSNDKVKRETSEEPDSQYAEAFITNQNIVPQTCLCTERTNIFAASSENNEPLYCSAVDSIRNRLVGCNNMADHKDYYLVRPSNRVPYLTLCKQHFNRMIRHNCCPKCGVFCTEGQFLQCKNAHLYHKTCQPINGDPNHCPHCGESTSKKSIYVEMQTLRPPVFMPQQKLHHSRTNTASSARMSFNSKLLSSTLENLITNGTGKSIFSAANLKDLSDDLLLGENKADKIGTETVLQMIQNDDLKRLMIILNNDKSLLAAPLPLCSNGTILHYAARKAASTVALHLLVSLGAEIDMYDKLQNTPLACAILEHRNEFVEYFLSAGANIMLKGTDGMTPLHLAAKANNRQACELLLKNSEDAVAYANTSDDGGWTPLVWACEQAHLDVTRLLLKKGANPLLRDVEQNVALHWAAFSGNADIVRLLLTYRSDINAVNVHGDSPLHVAARQDKYECVSALLLRNANVNTINKSGEMPLDCCKPYSDSHTAISLNVCLQSVSSVNPKYPSRVLINSDITHGREKNPIQCINEWDETPLPDDFVYLNSNCITCDEVQIDRKITVMHSCDCDFRCQSPSCVCCEHSMRCWYDDRGRLVENYNYDDPPMIFECNQLCSCNSILCNNRVVQHGITQRFEVFKTRSKGWGIRSLVKIPKGSFVCEYIGEIITEAESDRRQDDSFMFDMDNNGEANNSFCIDAKYYGNLSRFINHSCEPNLVPIRLYIEHHDLSFPRICFFARKDINEKEELSFDYGVKFWIVKYKSFTCECKTKGCKYSAENIEETLENYQKKLELGLGES